METVTAQRMDEVKALQIKFQARIAEYNSNNKPPK